MSIEDERELRGRLGGVLEAVDPSPAPVAATVRRGRLIRVRRQAAVAIGLAVVVGVAVGVPGLLRPLSREPQNAGKPKVTVDRLGPRAAGGLIGSGTINGKRWRLVVQPPGSLPAESDDQCFLVSGAVSSDLPCFPTPRGLSSDPADFATIGGAPAQIQYGVVSPEVTRLVVTLAGGTVLELHPTEAYGQRYVAFAIPLPLAIDRVVAYAGRAEIGHAIPFNSAGGDSIVAWLGPGQAGPPRVRRVVGSGRADGTSWSESVAAGPWGYCFTGPISSCYEMLPSQGNEVASVTGFGSGRTNWAFGTASAAVSYVRGSLSGGHSVRAATVVAGGQGFFALAIPKGERLVSVSWYTASGQQVASEPAAQIS